MKKTIFLDRGIEVLVVSAGGVGTTFLMRAIGQYRRTNCPDNTDGYKHLTIPPLSRNKELKIIYLFGDPLLACTSLFRRSYHHTQSVQNQKFMPGSFIIPLEMTLEQYCTGRVDGLHFKRHFHNWYSRFPVRNCLFVRYGALFDQLETIAGFLGLTQAFIDSFPPRQARHSRLDELDTTTIKGLNHMYGDFLQEIERTPDSFTSSPGASDNAYAYIFSLPYRIAIRKAVLRKLPMVRRLLHRLSIKKEIQ